MNQLVPISGSGGGGKKGGGAAKSTSNTLRTKATVRLVWLVSEGEIENIDTLYIDGTPLVAEDGTLNFKGVKYEIRTGLPDQAYFPSAPFVETPMQVEAEVTSKNGQVIRRVTEDNADAARVIVRLPALFSRDDKSGALRPASVSYQIKVRPFGGQFAVAHTEIVYNEKCTSPVQISREGRLPPGGAPWDIAVERTVVDSPDEEKYTNRTIWESLTTIVEGRFTYPNSALVYVEIDSEEFGSGTPTMSFGGRGMKTPVPSNYDPVTREYSGALWDGTFKTAWHSNPVWVLYDLITNDRYGIGEFIDVARLDKMSFYTIARYCDALVPAGYKDSNGNEAMEPRYKFNGTINTRDEAFNLLRAVANVFRGTTYWSLGQVFAVADMPADAAVIVTPANVYKGEFEFSGVSLDALHSVALVSWNDPTDHGQPATELIINDSVMNQFGWREIEVPLMGVASRGQALRAGLWVLDTEQHQDETIVYGAEWDHARLRPFDIIAVATPQKAGYRTGGRVVSATRTEVVVDAPIDFTAGVAYTLKCTMPDGSLATIPVASIGGEFKTVVTLREPMPAVPQPDAVWLITSVEVQQKRYRVLTIEEEESGFFKVTAVFHDPNKYARVEYGIELPEIHYTRPPRSIKPPTNLHAVENKYFENTVPKSSITVSWSPGVDFMSKTYTLDVSGPRGRVQHSDLAVPSFDITDVVQGQYQFSVVAVGYNGLVSEPATLDFYALSWDGSDIPYVADLRLSTGGVEFFGNSPEILWTPVFPDGTSGTNNPFFAFSIVKVYDARVEPPVLLRTEKISADRYTYTFDSNVADTNGDPARVLRFVVSIEDTMGRPSLPAELQINNPAPAAPIVEAQAGFNSITIYWEQQVVDRDFVGGDVHISYQLENPTPANLFYHGSGQFYVYIAEEFRPHYIVVGLYDSFSNVPANYSTPIIVTPIVSVADFEPPERPTGFAYTTELTTDGLALIRFSWNANTEEDMAAYEISVSEDDGGSVTLQTPELSYSVRVRPGAHIVATLTALDKMFNRSLRSLQTLDFIAAVDTVPPDQIEGLVIDSAFGGVWLSWTPSEATDLASYEIYENVEPVAPVADTKANYTSGAATFPRFGMGTGEAFYFAVRAVDTSGNKGGWSELLRGAALDVDVEVTARAIDEVIGRTEYARSIVVPTRVDVLPLPITSDTPERVFLSTDNRIYKPNDARTAWVDEGDATQIKGQFTTAQIAAGAIKAEQIAAGAITASSLLLGDTTNLVPNGDFTGGLAGYSKRGGVSSVDAAEVPPDGPGLFALKLIADTADPPQFSTFPDAPLSTDMLRYGVEAAVGDEFFVEMWLHSSAATDTQKIEIVSVAPDLSSESKLVGADTAIAANTWTRRFGGYKATKAGRLFVRFGKATADGTVTYVTRLRLYRRNLGELIVDGSITANMVTAVNLITLSSQIKDAVITDAKIFELSAAKLVAGTALASSITVNGQALSSIEQGATDPAARINARFTKLDPGQILISGATTLRDWRFGGDTTKIDGGNIAANTISANLVTIGLRGVTVDGIEFEANNPGANQVSWTGGTITYLNDAGASTRISVSGGSVAYGGDLTYLYWTQGSSNLSATTSLAVALAASNITLASYRGGIDLTTSYGRTVIDGSQIKTGSITATQIKAGAIESNTIAALAINSGHINSNAITARHISAGTITGDVIATNTIKNTNMADGSVGQRILQGGAVNNSKIETGAVTGDKIQDRTIYGVKVTGGGIGTENIAFNAIDGVRLQGDSVTAGHVVARQIIADKIAVNAIRTEHIQAGTIYADKIVAGEIYTEKLAGGAVTNAAYWDGQFSSIYTNGGTTFIWFWISCLWTNLSAGGTSPSATLTVYYGGSLIYQRAFQSQMQGYDDARGTKNCRLHASGICFAGSQVGTQGISTYLDTAGGSGGITCLAINMRR